MITQTILRQISVKTFITFQVNYFKAQHHLILEIAITSCDRSNNTGLHPSEQEGLRAEFQTKVHDPYPEHNGGQTWAC